jgi:PAS domain S-box-containing protein
MVPVRNADGTIVRVLGSLRDITREREAEAELRESRDRYSTLFEYSPLDLAVISVGPDGAFVYEEANPALLKSLGVTREQFVGHTPETVFSADAAAYVDERYRTCASTKSILEYEVSGRTSGGEFVRRTVLVPLFDEAGEVQKIFVTAMDLTEQRRMEEQLRQAQRLEAVGQLTGGIAHDFNNLLTVVMGNLDMLRRARPERAPRLIDNALSAVEHGRKLTSQLLAFSRRQPLKPEVVDLHALIGSMGDMLAQSLRGDIALDMDLAEGLWPVEVDPAQLQAALINLAANARDAMPKGGRFCVRTRNMISQNGGSVEHVAIEVSDTGTGIPPDALARVFEPFFTTKPVGQGTGLGLAQVYGFVQQSGGSVDIKSEVGRGTTVTLLLRRAQGLGARGASVGEGPSVGAVRSARILLVEDNPQVADLALALLQEQGHEVEHCPSAPDAVRLLERDSAFDLVFSDLVMPGGMDGLDCARVIRERWPRMPVLLATGYSEGVRDALEQGFIVLQKPFDLAALEQALREARAPTAAEPAAPAAG